MNAANAFLAAELVLLGLCIWFNVKSVRLIKAGRQDEGDRAGILGRVFCAGVLLAWAGFLAVTP